jgi:acetolactate synthase-1/2/3 large subunit
MPRANEVVADILVEAGIDHVFGVPGGATLFLYDALLDKQDQIRTVVARHEGGAACMADMYGRLTGKPGVVLGQGAWIGTNGAFGILEAFMAGSPMLVLADVSDYSSLLQFGPYQNVGGEYGAADLPSIMRAMTKYTTVANTPDEFVHGVQLAIKHATTGRPGPTCVLTRWTAGISEIDPEQATPKVRPLEGYLRVSPPSISRADAERVADLLLEAEDPVMVVGRGVHSSRAYEEVRELAERIGMPVATTYMGKSSIAETHELALGTFGLIGQQAANEKVTGADLLLAVGTCLAPENTKMLSPDFINPERQKIVQIDIEPLNIAWTFPVVQGITSDAKTALRAILEAIEARSPRIDVAKRVAQLQTVKREHGFFHSDAFTSDASPIEPERIVDAVQKVVRPDDLIVLDAGNNRMFFAKLFRSLKAGQIVAPGGAAGMGWGVPASLAAPLVHRGRRVISVCGDGSMMMVLYALQMAKQLELSITYVVVNNACLGNVMDFQRPERKSASQYPEANFAAIAESMGCQGIKVEKPANLESALKEAVESEQPTVVDVSTSPKPHFVLMTK